MALAGPFWKVAFGGLTTCTWTANGWGEPVQSTGSLNPDPATFVCAWFCWTTELISKVSPGPHTIEPVTIATVLLSVSVAFEFTPINSTWAMAALLVRTSAPNPSESAKSRDFDFVVIYGCPPLIFCFEATGARLSAPPLPHPRDHVFGAPRNAGRRSPSRLSMQAPE